MQYIIPIIAMIVLPYLLCGINSAIIVTKLRTGKDIREVGSGNAGLTNTFRTQGKFAALLVLAGDLLKGMLSVWIVGWIFVIFAGVETAPSWTAFVAGISGVLGHVFPVYYGFHGGKGVLVTAAALMAIQPLTSIIMISIFAVVSFITKYVSVGSIVAASLYPVSVLITGFITGERFTVLDTLLACVIAAMLILMHRENIRRLKAGTEKKIRK